ncbi:MAG: DUF2520 domain-containing protein [Bacteroidia bacterium]|nr:DUF2520 domain-containing protein [Bacteroidia bacterium]
MYISIIGAGNAANNLAIALGSKGHSIVWICNRTLEKAELLANKVGAKASSDFTELDWGKTELIIISTRDDGYEKVAQKLRTSIPVAHTSGSIPMNVLQECSETIGVFYPLQTMVKERPTDFSKVPFCIESNQPTFSKTLSELAGDLSNLVYSIDSEERKKLHLGAIFASNFSNFLYILSKDYLKKNGLPEHILDPLIFETAQRIEGKEPESLQTGPARRGDYTVISNHLNMLASNKLMHDVYQMMSQKILEHYGHSTKQIEKL